MLQAPPPPHQQPPAASTHFDATHWLFGVCGHLGDTDPCCCLATVTTTCHLATATQAMYLSPDLKCFCVVQVNSLFVCGMKWLQHVGDGVCCGDTT